MVTIADLMTDAFTVHRADAEPGDAPFVVVVDEGGTPYRISANGRSSPAILVSPTMPLEQVLAGHFIPRMLARSAAPGLVVVDGTRIAGVVPASILLRAMDFELRMLEERSIDTGLFGDARPISDAVRVRCRRCGTVNAYDYYLPSMSVDCRNGHPLDADLG